MDDSKVPLNDTGEDVTKANGVTVDFVKEEDDGRKAKEPGYKMKGLIYGVNDRPPFQIALVCALQVGRISVIKFHPLSCFLICVFVCIERQNKFCCDLQ